MRRFAAAAGEVNQQFGVAIAAVVAPLQRRRGYRCVRTRRYRREAGRPRHRRGRRAGQAFHGKSWIAASAEIATTQRPVIEHRGERSAQRACLRQHRGRERGSCAGRRGSLAATEKGAASAGSRASRIARVRGLSPRRSLRLRSELEASSAGSSPGSRVGSRSSVKPSLSRALFLGDLREDVDALALQLGLVVGAGDVRLHRDVDLGVQRDLHVEHADRLDRALENDLRLGDVVALGLQRVGDVADADRTVELARVRRGADQDDLGSVDAGTGLGGFVAARGVLGLETLAVGFEHLAVGFVGAQRLLVRQQEVARVAVLDGDHVADRAELLDAFEQDDFHDERSLLHDVGQQAQVAGALDRLGQLTLLLGADRGDAARDDLAALGHEALQQAHVLVVDDRGVLGRERAGLAAAEKRTGHQKRSSRSLRRLRSRSFLRICAEGTFLVLVDADGEPADHVLVDAVLPLELGHDGCRGTRC